MSDRNTLVFTTFCLALGLILLSFIVPVEAAEGTVDTSAPYASKDIPTSGGFRVEFGFDKGDENEEGPSSEGGDIGDADGPGDIGGGGGPIEGVEPHFSGDPNGVGQIFGPAIKGIANSVANALGANTGGGGQINSFAAQSLVFGKHIREQVPKHLKKAQDSTEQAFKKGYYFDKKYPTELKKAIEDSTDGDCLASSIRVPGFAMIAQVQPGEEQYNEVVATFLKAFIDNLAELSKKWNEEVGGFKLAYFDWSFNPKQFVASNASVARLTERALFSSANKSYVNALSAHDSFLQDCLHSLVDQKFDIPNNTSVDGWLDRYDIDEDADPIRREARELKEQLDKVVPQDNRQRNAKRLGQRSTIAADRSVSEGDREDAKFYLEVAEGMLDVATGLLPGVSVARDVYEVIYGENLITGEKLSNLERLGSLISASTLGVSGGVTRGAKVISRIADINDPRWRVAKEYLKDNFNRVYEAAKNLTSKTVEGWTDHGFFRQSRRLKMSQRTLERAIDTGRPYFDRKPENLSIVYFERGSKISARFQGRSDYVGVAVSPNTRKVKSVFTRSSIKNIENELLGPGKGPRWIKLPK